MDSSTIIWIIVAVVVVAAIIAVVVSRSGTRRVEAQRDQAAEIRDKAVEHDRRLREEEARATEADAKAQMARAEAQKRELEAERLAAEADGRSESAAAARRERDEHLRLADLRDPDVQTDEDGNRLNGRRTLDERNAVEERDTVGERVETPSAGIPTVRGPTAPSASTLAPPASAAPTPTDRGRLREMYQRVLHRLLWDMHMITPGIAASLTPKSAEHPAVATRTRRLHLPHLHLHLPHLHLPHRNA